VSGSTHFWERPEWDELTYLEQAAAMQAALTRLGYDPAAAQHQEEHRQLRAELADLKRELQLLTLRLQKWVETEEAAAKQRLDEYRTQR